MTRKKKWTEEKVIAEAKKYKTRSDFIKSNQGAYRSAQRNGWMEKACNHMLQHQKPGGYWTKSNIAKAAQTCWSRNEFKIKYSHAYRKARENDWLDDVCSHMTIKTSRPRGYWTKERVITEAKKYDNMSQFRAESPRAYHAAMRLNIKSDEFLHMTRKKKWTEEKVLAEAKKYKTRSDFRKSSKGAFNSAQRNGWMEKACNHMPQHQKPKGYWTKANIAKAAQTCKSRREFELKYSGAYVKARENKWLDDVCSHMTTKTSRPRGYWTKERVIAEAKNMIS